MVSDVGCKYWKGILYYMLLIFHCSLDTDRDLGATESMPKQKMNDTKVNNKLQYIYIDGIEHDFRKAPFFIIKKRSCRRCTAKIRNRTVTILGLFKNQWITACRVVLFFQLQTRNASKNSNIVHFLPRVQHINVATNGAKFDFTFFRSISMLFWKTY